MFNKRRIIFSIFLIITIVDLYNCFACNREFNQLIRTIQMLVLLAFVFSKTQFSLNMLLIAIALTITSIANYVFNKYGSLHENFTMILIIATNFLFLTILYRSIKKILHPSPKLYRWAFNYLITLVAICFLIDGFNNWLTYIIGIQSGSILLFISLQKNTSVFFNQLYFGYALIMLSLIFAKIILTDPRWFIELIGRFSYALGHLLFILGLANIKFLANASNISEYQIVE